MANDQEMSDWTDLLHSSSKLLELAAPSSQFPPLQRNLDQLEALSKKLKAKTLRNEAPSQSIAATRLLAREGINAEQLALDLKSFELKTTFKDVFPAEATSVEEYLQQVHEMAMVSAIQEAQKDNVRSFNDYMMKVLEEDWRKEKRDFLQSLCRISMLPKTNMMDTSRDAHAGQLVPVASSPRVSSTPGKELVALANIPIHEKKAYVYGEVVKKLNTSRERGLPFKPAMCFKDAYDTLGPEVTRGKSVNMQKIWQLVQAITGEDSAVRQGVSKRMSLAIGARNHLQRGHEKFIMDTIQSHPTQAALGGSVGNLQRIRAFLRIRLRDYGVLDFDSADARRQPPVDTTWQQIYFCLRTGYYEEAREVARSTRSSQQFAPLLTEWITTDGMVAAESAAIASEECEKMLRMGNRLGRTAYDKKKLLLFTIISGSRRQIEHILRDLSTLFNTIEDFLWFKLSCIRDVTGGSSSVVLNDGLAPYSLDDLQAYLNKFEPSYYTKNGKDPLVYPYVLLLSIQLLPAIMHVSKEAGDGGYNIDAVHIAITLVDHSVLSEGSGTGHKPSVMDSNAEASSMIRQYGSMFLHHRDLQMTVEYYAQAAATVGGGQLAWSGRSNMDQQRQRNLILKKLLTEILLREGGIYFLLGARGSGEEGQLGRFFPDSRLRQQFLVEAAHQCQEAGLYDKSIEIQKRVGAFSAALEIINKCLSEAICPLARGRLDGESRTSGLILAGNDILQTYKYYPEVSLQERERVMEQETILRELEAILSIHKLGRLGNHLDALREIAKLPFLNLDPRVPDATVDVFQSASPYFQTCVPDLLKVALTCLDNVPDTDGSIRAMRSKIAGFLASNTHRNWPHDLYEKAMASIAASREADLNAKRLSHKPEILWAQNLPLPYNLREAILVQLPVKILLDFKLVSKDWCEHISSTRFIHRQVELSASPEFFLVINDPVSQLNHPVAQLIDPSTQALSSSPIPATLVSRGAISTMVHCDGLFLCRCCSPSTESGPYTGALWNPALSEVTWFSRVPSAHNVYGIGYSSKKANVYKYKVLRFSDRKSTRKSVPRVQIFDYTLGSWRAIEATINWYCMNKDSVSAKGNMYWVAQLWSHDSHDSHLSGYFLQSFDFSKEEFKPLCNLPFNFVAHGTTFGLSSFRGDRLSYLRQGNDTVEVEVWVTNSLDEQVVSWSRYMNVIDPALPVLCISFETDKPMHFINERNGRLMVWCEEEEVTVAEQEGADVFDSVYEIGMDGIIKRFETARRQRYNFSFDCEFRPGYQYVPSLVPVPKIEEEKD